jgi:anthranilate phosphoribosyltransferase
VSETSETSTRGRSTYEGFRGTIKTVGTGPRGSRPLSFEEAREAMRALLAGEVSDAQAGAFLVAMRTKGEDPEELAGLAQALRDVALSREPVRPGVVACAGAYDGVADSPQLSLAAAVVAASAGAPCVIHCGERIGPKYGTSPAEVLAALGGPARPDLDASRRMLEASGVAVVHSGEAIPGWDRLARIRDEVGLRGPIHSAEKLVDHLGAARFVVGYTHQAYGPRILGALRLLGAESSLAVRGIEGSDVPRPGRPQASGISGLDLPQRLDLRLPAGGADPAESAAVSRAVLEGKEDGATGTAVVLGAMLRLRAAGVSRSVECGIAAAQEAITSGAATATLDRLLTAGD